MSHSATNNKTVVRSKAEPESVVWVRGVKAYKGVIGSQSNQGLWVMTVGPKDPVCVSIYTASSEGYSKLSLSKALRRYISLPIAFDQSAQLVQGLSGDNIVPRVNESASGLLQCNNC